MASSLSPARILSRAVLMIVCTVAGYYLNAQMGVVHPPGLGLFVGFGLAVFVLLCEAVIRKFSLKLIIGGTIGLAVGLIIAWLVSYPLGRFIEGESGTVAVTVYVITAVTFGYIGVTLGSGKIGEIRSSRLAFLDREEETTAADGPPAKLVDTSALIDGRIVGVIETGFLEGRLVVPRFVLNELQAVADSADHVKRQRGRRGMEILSRLREMAGVELEFTSDEATEPVDQALIRLANRTGAGIVTTDYNLSRIAEVQGVRMLNLNTLAEKMKPAILPGEDFEIRIIREGKSAGQGVGYLEDGTMVVVENGRGLINRSVRVAVTSILQTPAGRMIFTEPVTGRPGGQNSPSNAS